MQLTTQVLNKGLMKESEYINITEWSKWQKEIQLPLLPSLELYFLLYNEPALEHNKTMNISTY